MDVSRYEFSCQKALHQGLQYARSLGHQLLEVEHVALALLRADAISLRSEKPGLTQRLRQHLEKHLAGAPRVYGTIKVGFGRRLDAALDMAEASAGALMVTTEQLWHALCRQSTLLQTQLAHEGINQQGFTQPDSNPKVLDNQAFNQQHTNRSSDKAKQTKAEKPRAKHDPKQPAASVSSSQGFRGESTDPAAGSEDQAEPNLDKFDKDLRRFTVDLSAMAERDELDPVIGRDSEVRRVLEILGRKKKNNPILIGEPGVGKSAVAEAIALRIAEGAVPEPMQGKRVLALDLGAMLAGAKYRGEFEDRMKALLRALEALKGQIILFIDEIHMLVGAGNQEGGADAANLLKPALARGELQCLGATTLDEYRKHIEKDAALERRFQPLHVEEPDKLTALAIMRGLKARYEIHHGVQIDDEALSASIDLSVRYLPSRKLPDKAIDLVDEAASRLRLQINSVPAILDQLKAEIDRIEIERKAIGQGPTRKGSLSSLDVRLAKAKDEYAQIESIWRFHQDLLQKMQGAEKTRQEALTLYDNAKQQGDFDFAARLQYGELPRLDQELAQIRAQLSTLQAQHSFLRQVVGEREVAEVVAAWAKIPVGRLLESEAQKLLQMEERLGRRIFGQPKALSKIARAVRRARTGVNDPRRPIGVFLFLGPTGVGKTETARALAAELFADESKMVRIDMSEFMEQHSVARLIGAPPGYIGFGEGGELTEAVRRKPYSVVLFDEMEKAHPRVLDLLLQLFEDGRLTDGKGRVVDFRNTLMIMTSNLAVDKGRVDHDSHNGDPTLDDDQPVRASLTQYLRPELVNRIDEVVVFGALGRRHLEGLLDRLLRELNERLSERQLRVDLGLTIRELLLARANDGGFGGRALRRVFEAMIVDAVSDRILSSPDQAIGAWVLELDQQGHFYWSEEFQPHRYLPPAR